MFHTPCPRVVFLVSKRAIGMSGEVTRATLTVPEMSPLVSMVPSMVFTTLYFGFAVSLSRMLVNTP